MNAEAGKNPGGKAAGSSDSSVWPFGSEEAPLHCAGQVVPARFVRPEDAPAAPAAPAGTSCVELTVRSSNRPRGSGRVVSRVVETRPRQSAADVTAAKQPPRPAKAATPASQLSDEVDRSQLEPLVTAAPEPRPLPALPALPGPIGPSLPERVEPAEAPPGQELIKFHRLMRGRYRWAGVLAIAGLLGGAYAGWKLGLKTYQSTGYVQVVGYVAPVMAPSDENGVMPMFESFVNSQSALLRSQRVMQLAMDNPNWTRFNRGKDDRAKLRFAESITVTPEKEIIKVQVEDANPEAAMIAVKALLDAYDFIRVNKEKEDEGIRSNELEQLRRNHEAELKRLNDSISAVVRQYNRDDIYELFHFKLEKAQNLEATVMQLEMQLAGIKKDPQARAEAAKEMTVEQIAAHDQQMARLLGNRAEREEEVDSLVRRLGEAHRETLDARARLQKTNEDIESLASTRRDEFARGVGLGQQIGGVNADWLADQLKAYRILHAEASKDLPTLNDQALKMKEYREQVSSVEAKLAEVDSRIKLLDVEKGSASRIRVASEVDRPLTSYRDTRITFAAAGGLGGFMIGFGVVAALALCDRRLRSPDEAVGHGNAIPMLGLLPRLSLDLADPQEAATAAHCVHEIRTLLQIWGRGRDTQCFAITSPTPGTGKTSLTLALGAAYALAGRRTLMIDADLVGAGLTTRVDAIIRRRIGRILRNEGLVTPQQLEEALKLSQHSAARLGETLVQLGYVSEKDLNRAVLLQQNDGQPVGLIDALEGHDLQECVVELGIENLWVLPAGSADARYVPALSPEGLGRLIAAAREKFEIVLIDTGPMPGSLEASVVTALADGVILTVSKGEQKSMVQRSINQLIAVGARVTGVVFNRASHHDVSRYGSSSGASLRAGRSLRRGPVQYAPSPAAARLGPLAQAVASFAPGGCADASVGGSVIANADASSAASGELPA